MTVEQLIEELKQFDPKTEVRIEGTDPTDWRYVNEIEGIRLGEGDDDLEEYDDKDYELDEDGDPDYDRLKDSKKVVIINGGSF
jgi:hypothetical protein